ncbi:GEVED domain-containing protein [Nonomuraea sp. NPDC005650]|uniref:GEVED domain-containing protein n=1 Tax=Nonomuraea sp. NPDC005650 TaxID=3157045 RepID=UPI0033A537E2
MAFHTVLACVMFAGGAGAGSGDAPSSFTNSPATASGRTSSGVTVTVRKTMIGGTRVASAEVLPAAASVPADEYLVPANAKMTAGFMDVYEDFAATPGRWSGVVTLTFTFSRPVRDPHLHVFGTGGVSRAPGNYRDDYWPAIDLIGGTPARPAFSAAAGFPGYRVTADSIEPEAVGPVASTTCGVVYTCGTARVNGTVTAFTIRLRARDVRYGSGGPVPQLWAAFKLTLAEDDSDAPASYGAASHAITDSFLGRSVTADHPDAVSVSPRGVGADEDDAVTGSPARVAVRGRACALTVPVRAGSPAYVTGWIDADHDGRFDADERATAKVAKDATTAQLRWNLPKTLRPGLTWMRLRLAAQETASPTGWADSGEVEDHRIQLVRAERTRKRGTAGAR